MKRCLGALFSAGESWLFLERTERERFLVMKCKLLRGDKGGCCGLVKVNLHHCSLCRYRSFVLADWRRQERSNSTQINRKAYSFLN